MSLEDWAFSSNASWCERGLERTERVISGSQSPRTVVDGRETLLADHLITWGSGRVARLPTRPTKQRCAPGWGQEDRV